MLLAAVIVLLFASVPLTGGRLERLADLDFRGVGWIVAALVAQLMIIVVVPEGDTAIHRVVHVATYAAGAIFLWSNRHIAGMLVVGAGGMLNAVAITANDGVMPTSPAALEASGAPERSTTDFINSAPAADANLAFLGDVLAVPSWVPAANVFSVGDVLLIVGAAILLHVACRRQAVPGGGAVSAAPAT